MNDSLNIAIAGATGYVGLELINILINHPKVKILYLSATKSIGKSINTFDKRIKKKNLPKISDVKKINWNTVDVFFSGLPDGEAKKLLLKIPKKVKIIDLSADFRIRDSKKYRKWYGLKHVNKKIIKNTIYSITEFSKKELPYYRIISCPGCYPTSILLPLIPLLKYKLIKTENITIDSKSGYSGAGKNIKKKFKIDKLLNSIRSYGVGHHKHMGEIDQELSKAAKKKINVSFTPHLMPMFRGILSTIYLDIPKKNNAKKIYKFLKKYHKNNFFIKIANFNTPIGTGNVINSNFCEISVCKDRSTNKIIIISVIDNLMKGASGQAVQNMNVAFNFKENLGL